MNSSKHIKKRIPIMSAVCICTAFILLLTSCGISSSDKTESLKIGVDTVTGNFNPFYADDSGDERVNAQVFRSVQRRGADNKLINSAGSITYEYIGDEQVKYTVTVRNDLKYSDGTAVTIDDVIFFYYFIADATYDGVYKDFYLNDIDGLKEYYYDDEDYQSKLAALGTDDAGSASVTAYIKSNYSDGADVTEISGITRVDDYTCTVLCNSRNINTISQLNAVLVSTTFYGVDYVKGATGKVKAFTTQSLGCGPYYISDYDPDTHETELSVNQYYYDEKPAFSKLDFIDVTSEKKDAVELINSGKIDVTQVEASSQTIGNLSSGTVKYFIGNEPAYVSMFVNTRTIPDEAVRKQLMRLCVVNDSLDTLFGSYYTRVYLPLSVRFDEYPEINEPYYKVDAIEQLITNKIDEVNLYCCANEDSCEYTVSNAIADKFSAIGVKCNVLICDYATLKKAAAAGKADLWVMSVDDGATCDKYDYFNSKGRSNLTGLNDASIDNLTAQIRISTGFTDKSAMELQVLNGVMDKAVELPLYQLQNVTVYNTSAISPDCLSDLSEYDGYDYVIPLLK